MIAFVRDVVQDGADSEAELELSFEQFIELVEKLADLRGREVRAKAVTTPRLYMRDKDLRRYATIFRQRAGADHRLDANELALFFHMHNISVTPEQVLRIMAELDEDQSGYATSS